MRIDSPDSLVLIDSDVRRALRKPTCAKLFLHRVRSAQRCVRRKNFRRARQVRSTNTLGARSRRCKKRLFHRCFCNLRAMRTQRRRSISFYRHVRVAIDVDRARRWFCASHTHIVKWSQCFFHCSVVNGVQCVSIPDRTKCDTRHSKWLGGQQMAKRRKKAAKTAKKKGRKKRL